MKMQNLGTIPTPTPPAPGMPPESAWLEMLRIVGAGHVLAASLEDAIDSCQPQKIIAPGTADELARVLAVANSAGLRVAPRGGGSKLQWGNRPRALDLVLSTKRLNKLVEHAWADMTATVEAGCTVAELQRALAEHGQRLALDPLWPERATIGGILATNDAGSLRVRFGSLRDLIIGATVALPDGTLAKSGGKVVKNVAGYDLPKLVTGSLGTLGVITQAIFRLHPLPRESRTLSFTAPSLAALNQLSLAVLDSQLAYTGLQIRASHDGAAVLDVRFEGVPDAIDVQVRRLASTTGFERRIESGNQVWLASQALFPGQEPAVVAKFSVLQADISKLCDRLQHLARDANWTLVAQGVGVGMLRLESLKSEPLVTAFASLRPEIERMGGSLVLLDCPRNCKYQIDAWGSSGDAQPLMNRMKAQLDPGAILNPGRYVGGI
jgi:glycolate oxidase FAD binding subunit